jgi:hypothetical protein
MVTLPDNLPPAPATTTEALVILDGLAEGRRRFGWSDDECRFFESYVRVMVATERHRCLAIIRSSGGSDEACERIRRIEEG